MFNDFEWLIFYPANFKAHDEDTDTWYGNEDMKKRCCRCCCFSLACIIMECVKCTIFIVSTERELRAKVDLNKMSSKSKKSCSIVAGSELDPSRLKWNSPTVCRPFPHPHRLSFSAWLPPGSIVCVYVVNEWMSVWNFFPIPFFFYTLSRILIKKSESKASNKATTTWQIACRISCCLEFNTRNMARAQLSLEYLTLTWRWKLLTRLPLMLLTFRVLLLHEGWKIKRRMGRKFRLEIPLSSSSDCNVALENAFY